ncbi:kinetochore Sim4 complex subunit Fta4 [Hypoxylon sp. NC1633]|nr:kinetochore Sim4 complex subunit Fta4 [Hypoxylon sp. NC1633]
MAPPTILAHKSSFLTAQTLQLSQALAPSAIWRDSNARSGASALSNRVVDDALYRANHALQQHARRVYAPQASRHVAEQIEALYLEAAEKAVRGDNSGDGLGKGEGEGDEGGAAPGRDRGDGEARFSSVGADFATDEVILSLPSTWDLHSTVQAESSLPEARRYADLAASLSALCARRKEARARLNRLRRMRDLIAPFNSTPDTTGTINDVEDVGIDKVQLNLVTRDGDLEKELERMRVLLVRVAARVAQLPEPESGEDAAMDDVDTAERDKVERLLNGF